MNETQMLVELGAEIPRMILSALEDNRKMTVEKEHEKEEQEHQGRIFVQPRRGNRTRDRPRNEEPKQQGRYLVPIGIVLIVSTFTFVAPLGMIVAIKVTGLRNRIAETAIATIVIIVIMLMTGLILILVNEGDKTDRPRGRRKRDLELREAETPLWMKTQTNGWWKWANYTARMHTPEACMICAEAEPVLVLRPNPNNYLQCQGCRWKKESEGRKCPIQCIEEFGSTKGKIEKNCTDYELAYSKVNTNVDTRRLQLSQGNYECYQVDNGMIDVGKFPGQCMLTWICDATRVTENPKLEKGNETNLSFLETNTTIMPQCETVINSDKRIADMFWVCGKGLFSALPSNWTGTCARVLLVHPITIGYPASETEKQNRRRKREYSSDVKVTIDPIGQPRGMPNEFKARSEIAAGFESMIPWITINKNVEWINYIYYNQQRFINYTDAALLALGEQLAATSKMTRQNRQVLDWLLAAKGGVCVMFGEECCTFIPNNTSPEGTFTQAMTKLKGLRNEVYENAGFGRWMDDWMVSVFGKWGAWLTHMGLTIAVVLLVLLFAVSCCLPLLRSLFSRTIGTYQVIVQKKDPLPEEPTYCPYPREEPYWCDLRPGEIPLQKFANQTSEEAALPPPPVSPDYDVPTGYTSV